jgi:glucosamine-6-phosphate deaminase
LGTNGHVGFNEPAESLPQKAYQAALAPVTMARAREELADEPVAPYGLTLSLAQIMSAQEVVLIASGTHKARAVSDMLSGEMTTSCPASLLHLHPAATAIIDEAAAAAVH